MLVKESEMYFPDHWLSLEKTDLYQKKLNGQGVAIVDFVYFDEEKKSLNFIEAKTSIRSAHLQGSEECKKCLADFQECSKLNNCKKKFIIKNPYAWKFVDSISLYASLSLKRWQLAEQEQTEQLKKIPLPQENVIKIKLVLIVKNDQETDLSQIQDELRSDSYLKSVCRLWNIKNEHIVVLNEEMALRKKLCFSSEDA
jgi:hypothetical protein